MINFLEWKWFVLFSSVTFFLSVTRCQIKLTWATCIPKARQLLSQHLITDVMQPIVTMANCGCCWWCCSWSAVKWNRPWIIVGSTAFLKWIILWTHSYLSFHLKLFICPLHEWNLKLQKQIRQKVFFLLFLARTIENVPFQVRPLLDCHERIHFVEKCQYFC